MVLRRNHGASRMLDCSYHWSYNSGALDMKTYYHKYRHAGGRIYIQHDDGKRDLIVDLYAPAERRDAIVKVLLEAKIISDLEIINI